MQETSKICKPQIRACPPVEEICKDIEVNVLCNLCNKVFSNTSALRMHKHLIHHVNPPKQTTWSSIKGDNIQFHCPDPCCKYGVEHERFFTTFAYLKQHYMKVHAPKKFECGYCQEGFSLERFLRTHLKKCKNRQEIYTYVNHPEKSQRNSKSEALQEDTIVSKSQMAILSPISNNADRDSSKRLSTCFKQNDRKIGNIEEDQTLIATVSAECRISPAGNALVDSDTHDVPVACEGVPTGNSLPSKKRMNILPISNSGIKKCKTERPCLPKPNIFIYPGKITREGILVDASKITMVADMRQLNLPSLPVPIAPKLDVPQNTNTSVKPLIMLEDDLINSSVLNEEDSYENSLIQIENDNVDTSKDQNNQHQTFSKVSTLVQVSNKNSLGTQTLKKKKGLTAETQTQGDLIMIKAMESAEIPVQKESRSSQVSPRDRLKLIETTTQTNQSHQVKPKIPRNLTDLAVNTEFLGIKNLVSVNHNISKTDFATNTEITAKESQGMQVDFKKKIAYQPSVETQTFSESPDAQVVHLPLPSVETQTSLVVNISHVKSNDQKSTETQTNSTKLLSYTDAESTSTQTLNSFLSQDPNNPMSTSCLRNGDVEHVKKLSEDMYDHDVSLPGILNPKTFCLPEHYKNSSHDHQHPLSCQTINSPQKVSDVLASTSSSSTSYYRKLRGVQKQKTQSKPNDCVKEKSLPLSKSDLSSTWNNSSSTHSVPDNCLDNVSPFSNCYSTEQNDIQNDRGTTTADLQICDVYIDSHVQTEFDPLLPGTADNCTEMESFLSSVSSQTNLSACLDQDFRLPLFLHTDTQTPTDLGFIHSDTQTTDESDGLMHTETQTHSIAIQGNIQTQTSVDDLFLEQIWSNMETQTNADDFLASLDFADIETQTSAYSALDVPSSSYQTSSGCDTSVNTVQTQTSILSSSRNLLFETTDQVSSTDIQTQTFDSLLLENDFTDSHTQTRWHDTDMYDLKSFMDKM